MRERKAAWEAIRNKHFGQCQWQEKAPNGRGFLEGWRHNVSGQIVVVQVFYAGRIPRSGSGKEWPDIQSVCLWVPIKDDGTWAGVDAALTELK